MFALHAGFCARRLTVWGESSTSQGARRTKRGTHPLDAGPQQLLETLSALGVRPSPREFSASEIWLPSVRNSPFPSGTLIAEMPANGNAKIASWKVTTVALTPAAALELL